MLTVPGGLDPGTGVKVMLASRQRGAHPVSLEFDQVTSPGVASATSAPPEVTSPRTGYRLSGNAYLDLSSTAKASGPLRICVDHTGIPIDPATLTLQQWTGNGDLNHGGRSCGEAESCWREITESSGSAAGTICGATENLGRVALLERLGGSVSSRVLRRGANFEAQVPLADPASLDGASWDWGDSTPPHPAIPPPKRSPGNISTPPQGCTRSRWRSPALPAVSARRSSGPSPSTIRPPARSKARAPSRPRPAPPPQARRSSSSARSTNPAQPALRQGDAESRGRRPQVQGRDPELAGGDR